MNPNSASWKLERDLELVPNTYATRTGAADPTGFVRDGKIWRAAHYSSGPATVSLWTHGGTLRAEAWGPGAACALDATPKLVGLADDDTGFDPSHHPLVRDMARKRPGIRLARTEGIFDIAVRAVLGQKVTGLQAKRSYQALVRRVGKPAPLPRVSSRPLLMPPTPEDVLRALAGHGATALGIDIARADALRQLALAAHRLEALGEVMPHQGGVVREALQQIPGIGVWTANEVTVTALGDPDAVSVGDFHLKNHVTFALTGAPRGTDEQMLALLEPFRPHRARAVRLIVLSGLRAPRYGPRMSVPTHVPLFDRATPTGRTPSRGGASRSRASRIPRRAR